MSPKVVVTYTPTQDEKAIITSELNSVADIQYLPVLNREDRRIALEKAEILFSRSFAKSEIENSEAALLKKISMIQLIFAGADKVPFERVPRHATVVSNAGAFADPLAEHVLAMALCLARSILPRHMDLKQGKFNPAAFGTELKGGICGIIGMGGNGVSIARLMRGVGMAVHGINRSGRSTVELDFMGTLADMDDVLDRSDVIVLTVPLNRQTRNLIGRRELEIMKPDAILVNVARGEVVDQQALYRHLKSTPTFRAGIDTWWSEPGDTEGFKLDFPFFDLPNLIGSPHCADHVPGSMQTGTQAAARNVRRFLEGKSIRGVLDRNDYTE